MHMNTVYYLPLTELSVKKKSITKPSATLIPYVARFPSASRLLV